MIGYSKKNRENYPRKYFRKKVKKPGLKFNPGLALTGVRTTGPWAQSFNPGFSFLCSKVFSRIIFSVIFRQLVDKKN